MLRHLVFLTLGIFVFCSHAAAQAKRTSVPVGTAVADALRKVSLTGEGARPFHLRMTITEPKNSDSPFLGKIEEWWISPDQLRMQISEKGGMSQTVVITNGTRSEKDQGDYFPLWLRQFVDAVNDPVPNPAAWPGSEITIDQMTLEDGRKSDPCARTQSTIGSGERATDAFSTVCFDGDGRLKSYISPARSVFFRDYKGFGKKQIARELETIPERGISLVGKIEQLEELKSGSTDHLFDALDASDDRFRSVHADSEQMERLIAVEPPIQWPAVHSLGKQGHLLQGHLALYISVDSEGNVREAKSLYSDNFELNEAAKKQVMHWKLAPVLDKEGKPSQLQGGIGFAFDTTIADPWPELSDSQVRALAIKKVEPVWPESGVKYGQVIKLPIQVNEEGKLVGMNLQGMPAIASEPLRVAMREWRFQPLMKDGKPQYFEGTLEFIVK
jgi:hypothetical protein